MTDIFGFVHSVRLKDPQYSGEWTCPDLQVERGLRELGRASLYHLTVSHGVLLGFAFPFSMYGIINPVSYICFCLLRVHCLNFWYLEQRN